MQVYSGQRFYLYNLYKKKFLSKPYKKMVEVDSNRKEKFPVFRSSIKDAIAFTLEKLVDISVRGSNNLMTRSAYLDYSPTLVQEDVPIRDDTEFAFIESINGIRHSALFITGKSIKGTSYQVPLENALVSRARTIFYISNKVSLVGGTDIFIIENGDGNRDVRAYVPFALLESVSRSYISFPIDPELLDDVHTNAKGSRDDEEGKLIFQWILFPVETYGTLDCIPVVSTEFLDPVDNVTGMCINSKGVPFFSKKEHCVTHYKKSEFTDVTGWNISNFGKFGDQPDATQCVSTVRANKIVPKFNSIGDCFRELKTLKDSTRNFPKLPEISLLKSSNFNEIPDLSWIFHYRILPIIGILLVVFIVIYIIDH